MSISDLRKQINEIDEELRKLFERRMKVVGEVAKYKLENNLDIFDKKRETEVISKNSQLLSDKTLEKYYVQFLNDVMKVSKAYQKDIIG